MDDLPTFLHDLPSMGFGFMLVIARVGTTLLTGPALGENEIPTTVRIALAVVLGALVYPLLRSSLPPPPDSVIEMVGLLTIEIIVGAWLGFITRVLVMALSIAGGIISFMVGLSSVLQIDPSLGVQVPALERMLGLAAVALLFASGLYVLPVQAVMGSYDIIPPGSAFDAGGAAQWVTRAVAESFDLALRLAAPFVVICIVWQAALAFLSRLVPNIQVQLVSAPAQILAGLALFAAATGIMFTTWSAGVLKAFSSLPGL
ncbi:MAG: flagellar biosynthetic protein FliR [Acetobacteraceae bacterium]|nr:flagellar biosynthetic protein FliR [Acetobacteraceae bacterium]